MKKFLSILVAVLMTFNFVNVYASAPVKIKTIKEITANVLQGDDYQLPKTVTANYTNNSKKNVAVKWNTNDVNTDNSGKIIYYGKVAGYTASVKLTLNVRDRYMSDCIKHFNLGDRYLEVYYNSKNAIVQGEIYTKVIKYYPLMWIKDNPTVSYNLKGLYTRIEGQIAIDDNSDMGATVEVYGDEALLETYNLESGAAPQDFNVDVSNVKILKISIHYLKHDATVDIINAKLIK